MANTVTTLSYANTFGDWVIITDQLVTEVNSLGFGNYIKSNGQLTLAGSGTGLQVSNNAVIQGGLIIQGTGQALQVSKDVLISGNLVVSGNTTISGFEIDYGDITSNTIHANTVTINTAIGGTNNQLNVSTDLIISGNLVAYGNTTLNLDEVVIGTVTANIVNANSFQGVANTQINQQISDSSNTSISTALAFSIALG